MEDVKDWLINPNRAYSTGIEIFARYCKNVFLVRYLKNRTDMPRLEYELKKVLGIPLSSIFGQKCSNQQLINSFANVKEKKKVARTIGGPSADKKNIPVEIEQAKKEIPELYTKVDMMHSELYELGASNALDVIEKRKRILERRKPVIVRLERLYALKEEYFITGKLSEELKELLKKNIEDNTLIVKNSEISKLKDLSDFELAKRKSAVASSITKLKNKLNYQSISKLSELRPLPEGPVRDNIKEKLKLLLKEQKEIHTLINRRNG